MSIWKKFFKKTQKENKKNHEEEMKYFSLLEKRIKKLEAKLDKKNKKKK
jgi:hypothetical protein